MRRPAGTGMPPRRAPASELCLSWSPLSPVIHPPEMLGKRQRVGSVDSRMRLNQLRLNRGPRRKPWASGQLLIRDKSLVLTHTVMTPEGRALLFPNGAGCQWGSPLAEPCGHHPAPANVIRAAGPQGDCALNFHLPSGCFPQGAQNAKAGGVFCFVLFCF